MKMILQLWQLEGGQPHSRGSTPHPRRKSKHRSKSRPRFLECRHCHEKGHRKSDCPSLRKKKHFLYDGASTSSAGIVIANFDNGAYVLCTSAFGDNKWMLDLDSSYHTCPKHSFFYTYQETFGCIEVENGVYHDIVGMGNGRFRMFDGIVRTLTNIKHILDI